MTDHEADLPPPASAETESLPIKAGTATISKGELLGLPESDRSPNQDYALSDPRARIYAVADGVGGERFGDMASRTCAEAFAEEIEGQRKSNDGLNNNEGLFRSALKYADTRLKAEKDMLRTKQGATTLVGAVELSQGEWGFVNIGDSAAFILRSNGIVEQVTKEQAAPTRPDIITNSLGGELSDREITGDVFKDDQVIFKKLEQGDRILLASDGFTGDLPNQRIAHETIAEAMQQYPDNPQACAEALTRLPEQLEERGDYLGANGEHYKAKKDDRTVIVINPFQDTAEVETTEHNPEQTRDAITDPESSPDHQTVQDILKDNTNYATRFYTRDGFTDKKHPDMKRELFRRFGKPSAQNKLKPEDRGIKTQDSLMPAFANEGVAETITVIDDPSDPEQKLITYETMTRGGSPFEYLDRPGGRPGNILWASILVSSDEAERLLDAIREDGPTGIREAMANYIKEQYSKEYGEDIWEKGKPPYDEWQKNGAHRLAVRYSFGQGPEDSELIDYSDKIPNKEDAGEIGPAEKRLMQAFATSYLEGTNTYAVLETIADDAEKDGGKEINEAYFYDGDKEATTEEAVTRIIESVLKLDNGENIEFSFIKKLHDLCLGEDGKLDESQLGKEAVGLLEVFAYMPSDEDDEDRAEQLFSFAEKTLKKQRKSSKGNS